MTRVLIVEDDDALRDALIETLSLAEIEVKGCESAESALCMVSEFNPNIVVSDIRMDKMTGHGLLKALDKKMPGLPVMLVTAHGTVNDAIDAMRFGAVDYLLKPFEPKTLIEKINRYAKSDDKSNKPVATDEKSQALLALAKQVANSDATVLISGESGTGKEVLARYIHDHSPRAKGNFIAINCAAIPEHLLESTLFGYEKGAFTGANKASAGKFEQAQNGTLLLDEISEMDLSLQAKLLRVLQEKEVERLGSNKVIKLDVRVLATTNRDMKSEIEAKRFREDLYYRLNVFPLYWLPLRERQNDIVPLANYLIKRHMKDVKGAMPILSDDAKKALYAYSWPGNAREMDNVIQRALILKQGDEIQESDLQLLTDNQNAVISISKESEVSQVGDNQ